MRLVRFLGTALAIAILVSSGQTQNQAGINGPLSGNSSFILCGEGLAGGDCELARGIVRLALSKLSTSIPGWRFVVVPASQWKDAVDRFHVRRTTPAFSILGIHTTYVEASLVFQDGRVDENLQRYTSATGLSRLTWVVAHESGHILCQTADERRANAAAGRLTYGRGNPCR